METNTEQIGNVLKIKVIGRLVAGCAEEFKQMLMTSTKTSHQILLDLSQMNYIDSSGLG
ncbi:MAG: STAS domain-containing protein, partial [Victivallales bacterium]|nr:STAS domain-containing protein [Victivallales bacterium]